MESDFETLFILDTYRNTPTVGGIVSNQREQEADGADKSRDPLWIQSLSSVAALQESWAVGRGGGFLWAALQGLKET